MEVDKLLGTFDKHKAALQEIFRRNRRIHDSQYVPELPGLHYLLVLTELLTENQQGQMYLKIRSEFDPAAAGDIRSNVCYRFHFQNYFINWELKNKIPFSFSLIFSMKICSGKECCRNGGF